MSHISHGILFAVSFRAVNFWQEFKSCPESLVAFLIMEPSVLFHSKLWMLNWWTNWIFCLISPNGIFIKSYCQHGFLVDLYGSLICMNLDMNSSLVLLKLDVKLNLLSHISQWNFVCNFIQSCLPLKSCHFKSRCPIEAFVAYLKMKSCLLFHLKLWIFLKNSSLVFKSRCQIS